MNKPSPFTEKQRSYLTKSISCWLNVAEGGKRGGKNVLQTMAFCIALDKHPNRLHLIAGVSAATARLNIVDCDGFGLTNFFEGRCRFGTYQKRECLYVSTQAGQKIVLISGGGKRGDEKLIKGNTYGMAYVTEANECAPDFLRECFDRTLSSQERKVFHDLNPKGESHWYYTDVLAFHEERQRENPNYGFNYGHFTIADNASIADDQLERILASYDKRSLWYQRDILGIRKQAEGLVYPMFSRESHVIPCDERAYGEYQVSIDYGTYNPFHALLWGLSEGVWYCVREFRHCGRGGKQKDPTEYLDDLARLWGELPLKRIIIDPSADGFITLLRNRGRRVTLADNAVLAGIECVSTCLHEGLIKVNECCEHLIAEFGLYAWDDNSAKDTPLKEHDHGLDALRYFAYTNKLTRRKRKYLEG